MKKMDMRKELMRAFESLPEYQIPLILTYIKAVQKGIEEETRRVKAEMIFQNMQSVPEEDYELSDEELDSIAKGREDIKAGRVHRFEDVARELDM